MPFYEKLNDTSMIQIQKPALKCRNWKFDLWKEI